MVAAAAMTPPPTTHPPRQMRQGGKNPLTVIPAQCTMYIRSAAKTIARNLCASQSGKVTQKSAADPIQHFKNARKFCAQRVASGDIKWLFEKLCE